VMVEGGDHTGPVARGRSADNRRKPDSPAELDWHQSPKRKPKPARCGNPFPTPRPAGL
jgi:hypothetical protein